MRLYDSQISGNSYKARLLLSHVGRPCELVPIDLLKGEGKTDSFRAKVPLGRVPALGLDDGTMLGESSAILWFLAEGTSFMPATAMARAQTLQWLSWEQYDHEPYVAVLRAWKKFFGVPTGLESEVPYRTKRAYAAFDVMERHLSKTPFFVEARYGLADIALYAYTHCAHEAELSLTKYPHITAWLEHVRTQPRHVAMRP